MIAADHESARAQGSMGVAIFTIGHSTHSIEDFLGLLRQHRIDCVIDVRSTPYSRRVPHFNRERLQAILRADGILYAHMPEEFGARKNNPELLDPDKKVNFDRVRETKVFRAGIERIKRGAEQGYRIALMCSEADPFDCHRFSMITYQLVKEGLTVQHILRNGQVLDNSVLERRLLQHYCAQSEQQGLFDSGRLQVDDAYRLRGREVAFSANGGK